MPDVMHNRAVYLHPWAQRDETVSAFKAAGLEAMIDADTLHLVHVTLPSSYPANYDLGKHIRTRMPGVSGHVQFVCDPPQQYSRYETPMQRNE